MSQELYPLTITRDRYGGTYSGGEFIAWNLHAYQVPVDPFSCDVTAACFWYSDEEKHCAVGDTIAEAIENLRKKLK